MSRKTLDRRETTSSTLQPANQPGTTLAQDAAFDHWLDDMDELYDAMDDLIHAELEAMPQHRHRRHQTRPAA